MEMGSESLLGSFLKLVLGATPEGKLVNLLIVAAFFLGFCSLLRHRAVLKRLSHELSAAKDALRRSGMQRVSSAGELFARLGWKEAPAEDEVKIELAPVSGQPSPPPATQSAAEVRPDPVPTTELQRHVLATYWLASAGRSGVQVLTELGALRRDAGIQLPRYLVSILVLLGLGGTVWGLQGIVHQAGSALSGQTTSVEALIRALRPMGMAFSCTFCGILASVLLAWALAAVERKQDALDAELGEFLVADIVPLVGREASPAASLKAMRDVLNRGTEFIDRFANAVAETRDVFAQTIRQAVHDAASEMLGSVSQMRDVAKEMGATAQSLDSYRTALEADRESFQRLLRETRDATTEMVRLAVEPIVSLTREVEETAEELRSLRSELVLDRESWTASYRALIQEDRQSHEQIVRQTQDAALELVRSAVSPIEATAESLRRLYDKIDADRGGWEAWFQERLRSVVTACESLGSAAQQMREISSHNGETIHALISRMADAVDEYAAKQRDAAELLSDAVARVSPSSIKTRDGKRLEQLLTQFDEATLGLQRDLQNLARKSEETLNGIRAVADDAAATMIKIASEQARSSARAVELLSQVRVALEAPFWTRILGYRR